MSKERIIYNFGIFNANNKRDEWWFNQNGKYLQNNKEEIWEVCVCVFNMLSLTHIRSSSGGT